MVVIELTKKDKFFCCKLYKGEGSARFEEEHCLPVTIGAKEKIIEWAMGAVTMAQLLGHETKLVNLIKE